VQGEAENVGDSDYDPTPNTSTSTSSSTGADTPSEPIEDVYDPDAAGE
jgi:hypothetical protein